MSLSPQVSVWDLWSELARNTESLGDPLFLECLEAASSSRLFDDLTDDKVKMSMSLINSLLNDPKTKPKGLTLFSDLSCQINPARLIGFQDAVISSLHLVVKGLESPLANTALVNFLPKCHCMSEVNQIVTSSIVPKILSFFVEENRTPILQRSVEEFALLKMCLVEYHGPCGPFRDKLEKTLMPLMDSENNELIQVVSEVMPLVSYAGGGGNAGEKHIKDWNAMLTKYLKSAYATLVYMYGDTFSSLEPDNPFDGEQLTGLKRITESQVLLRLSLLKRRLQNLLTIISGYLRSPFPAPKLVPQKGILKLITSLASMVPLNSTRSGNNKIQTKENAFLSAITPGVHSMELHLMRSLFDCVGSNIFTEGAAVEQILSSEFKWLQEKPKAFEKLRLELYGTVTAWLALTGGNVTSAKTLTLWTNAIGVDTRVEKDVVELKILSKPKPGKSVKLMNTSSMSLSSGASTQTFVQKSPDICQAALKTLSYLIPVLDVENHRKIYEHLLKTISIICQFHCPPSPYDNPECRKLIYKDLTELCLHPHPQSPISISLMVTLLRRGMQDPTTLVSTFCAKNVSHLERLLHPISAPLLLAGAAPHPVVLSNSYAMNFINGDTEREEEILSVNDDDNNSQSVQRESDENANPTNANELNTDKLLAVLKEKMDQTMKEFFSKYSTNQDNMDKPRGISQHSGKSHTVETIHSRSLTLSSDCQRPYDVASLPESDNDNEVIVLNGNGHHLEDSLDECIEDGETTNLISDDNLKRKACNADDDTEPEMSKKTKTSSPSKTSSEALVEPEPDGPTVEEMLSTFVDVEPVA